MKRLVLALTIVVALLGAGCRTSPPEAALDKPAGGAGDSAGGVAGAEAQGGSQVEDDGTGTGDSPTKQPDSGADLGQGGGIKLSKKTCAEFTSAECTSGAETQTGQRCALQPSGDCADAVPDKCSEYPVAGCQGKSNARNIACDAYPDVVVGVKCDELREPLCGSYPPAECTGRLNEHGAECDVVGTGFCGNKPRPICADYMFAECGDANPISGAVCQKNLVRKICEDRVVASGGGGGAPATRVVIRQHVCSDYSAANGYMPADCNTLKTLGGQDCESGAVVGTCQDKAFVIAATATCYDVPPAACTPGTVASGKPCKILNSGECGNEPTLLVTSYFEKDPYNARDIVGKKVPLNRQPVFTPPLPRAVPIFVHCLGRSSLYFADDKEVVRAMSERARIVDEPFFLYRHGQKKIRVEAYKVWPNLQNSCGLYRPSDFSTPHARQRRRTQRRLPSQYCGRLRCKRHRPGCLRPRALHGV